MMTILAFLVTIGLLVVVHEYGHYIVARWCGIKVLRFSIGFGKTLWKKTSKTTGTEFVVSAIPLGGYVKMLDERELKAESQALDNVDKLTTPCYTEEELQQAFNRKSVYQRIAVVLAGPCANLLLAIFLYAILFMSGVTLIKPFMGEIKPNSLASVANLKQGDMLYKIAGEKVESWQDARWLLLNHALESKSVEIETVNAANELHVHTLNFDSIDPNIETDILERLGIQMAQPTLAPVIGNVIMGSSAEKAGLQENDRIVSINNIDVFNWENVVSTIKQSPGKALFLKVDRHGNILKIKAIPEAMNENGKTIGRLGAAVKYDASAYAKFLIEKHYGLWSSLEQAVYKTWETAFFSLKMLGNMLLGTVSWKAMSGPVSIAAYAGESASIGLKSFLGFLALISISIGVLNLLPIPVLDGGHLMYYIVEILKGSPVSEETMMTGQKIGLALLGFLMMVALFNDVSRYLLG